MARSNRPPEPVKYLVDFPVVLPSFIAAMLNTITATTPALLIHRASFSIHTKHLPPTGYRGSRVKVWNAADKKESIVVCFFANEKDPYDNAVNEWFKKFGDRYKAETKHGYKLVKCGLKDGYLYTLLFN